MCSLLPGTIAEPNLLGEFLSDIQAPAVGEFNKANALDVAPP
jgi:hypothetical protein